MYSWGCWKSDPTPKGNHMNRWDLAPSVAFTCLLEFPWYANADSRVTNGLSAFLVQQWRDRVAAGSTIDCYTLAGELEPELRALLRANAARLNLTLDEG